MSECLLEASDLSMRFGGLLAVDQMALKIHPGEIVSMIGPNGAGENDGFQLFNRFLQSDWRQY